ncbi:hypothetical protein [Nocardioides antri]|uniref:HEPN/Toprim N-terminal domain-containing protein n=1 Tax=Nocardioides antri TaxID=2607659 RepID=A0A5B1M4V9_9ACTN|nr:hypothetical protein [Nocardioides antri]KAA1427488.1 hypothetical protein F0U47_08450 [Nocardioides antri]
MSATWDLKVGRRTLMWGKRFVPDQIMVVFYDEDLRVNRDLIGREEVGDSEGEELSGADVIDDSSTPAFFYRSTVHAIRSRLALQGFGSDRVRQSAVTYLDGERDQPDRYLPETWVPLVEKFRSSEQLLDAMLAWEADSLRGRRLGGSFHSEDRFLESQWEDLIEAFDDPRFMLALKLRRARGSTELVLDMTDLLFGGYFEADELPHRTARQRYSHEIRSSGPVIVVTEGRTDARWLTRALELAAPELAGAFSFLDFEGNSAPGGVDRVVSLTRGMAAAGVMNRVIAVLDNDAAGLAAEQQLRRSALPSHITVVRLPDIEYGNSYPTIGPNGAQLANVNGQAVTTEFMFGTGVLATTSGTDLLPVRWGGYNPSVQAYQGAIENKSEVNGRIDRALSVSELDDLDPLVAEGCHRLVGMLVQGAAEAIPSMASQYSPLLWGRARED